MLTNICMYLCLSKRDREREREREREEWMCCLDMLNIFYLWLYGIGHRKRPLRKVRESSYNQISSKGSFICIIPQHLLPVVGHWMERKIAQCVHHEGSIRRPIADTLTTELHLAPVLFWHHCISIKRTNYFSNPHQKRGNFTRLQRQMTHKKTQTHSPHNRVQISKEMTQLPREITKQNSCQGR